MKYFLLACTLVFGIFNGHAQTLIINEVSNGPSGSKEYIELVVVDTVAYNCAVTTPPCIDIRNWIIDDNSGYHSTGTSGTGVAPGCNRFSNDPLWSCVPLGTIIVIYNNNDPNPALPADDLSLSDGNCVLVVPINDVNLFEQNSTTPGASACSYPTTGWVAGGNWSNIGMANGGDCARIVDLNGCEVFSVCWGNNDQNNLIYFAGNGADDVWYFNDMDPDLQVNWTEACASIADCGADEQTPGAPNNALNANYIAQYNNGCAPITPIVASVTGNNASCPCAGEATASATGSIPGYMYEWYDNTFTPIGQDSVTAIGLCDGTYHVIAISSIGCEDTATVTITNGTAAPNAGTDATFSICDTSGTLDLFDYLGGLPDNTGNWSGPSTLTGGYLGTFDPSTNSSGSYEYTVGGGVGCPDSTATVTISIETSPDAGNDNSITFCTNDLPAALFGQLTGTPQTGGTWAGPSALNGGHLGTFDPGVHLGGNYDYIVAGTVCPNDTASMTVTVNTQATASIDPVPSLACLGGPFQFSTSSTGGSWSANCTGCIDGGTGEFFTDSAGVGVHEVYYTIPGSCGDIDTAEVTVLGPPTVTAFPDTAYRCPNDTATFWATGENIEWYNGVTDTFLVFADSGSFYVTASNACGNDTAYVHIVWINSDNCGEPADPISWMLFPNIVTSNGDGMNDVFMIKEFQNISDLEVSIYNRWGQYQGGWEGTDGYWYGLNQRQVQVTEGTYFYIARAKDWKDEPYLVKGHFFWTKADR